MAGAENAGEADNVFATIDAKLNMFALANGIDLIKTSDSRRLLWFMDGLERGLTVTAGSGDGLTLSASAWPTNAEDEARTSSVGEGVSAPELTSALERGIEIANDL